MCKNTLILSILCVFACAIVCLAEEGMPAKEDTQKLRQSQERIEKLRTMAREAEEKARNFRVEAEELEQVIQREFEGRPMPEQIEPAGTSRRAGILDGLKKAAERAEREGRHDEAADLREKAMAVAKELEAQQNQVRDRKRAELKEKLIHLEKMAREAKEQGEMDKAERLWVEAKELEQILKREFQEQEKNKHVGELQAKLAELKEAAGRAEQQGRHDEAAELIEKAKQIAREIEETTPPGKIRSPKNEIERLRALAAEAKEAGQPDRAEAILREAKELERKIKGPVEGKMQPPAAPELIHQIEILREEVGRLRKDVEELRQLVRRER